MAIADQALEDLKRGKKVGLVVPTSNRAEDLSRSWRAADHDVKEARAKNRLKCGKGQLRFIIANAGATVEMVSGYKAVYYIEPEAFDVLSPRELNAIRAASVQ